MNAAHQTISHKKWTKVRNQLFSLDRKIDLTRVFTVVAKTRKLILEINYSDTKSITWIRDLPHHRWRFALFALFALQIVKNRRVRRHLLDRCSGGCQEYHCRRHSARTSLWNRYSGPQRVKITRNETRVSRFFSGRFQTYCFVATDTVYEVYCWRGVSLSVVKVHIGSFWSCLGHSG